MLRLTTVARTRSLTTITALAIAVSLALVSCGGGGGGGGGGKIRNLGDGCPLGTGTGTLHYITNWGGAPALASQFLELLDVDGNVLRTAAINRSQGTTVDMPAVTPGVYELRARLYSQENAGGVEIGRTSTVVDLCGKTVTVKTTNAQPPTQVKVKPTSFTLLEQQSKKMIATAVTGLGEGVFLPDGTLIWSVLGGVGTVSQEGLFTATTAGNGAVRASINSPSLSGAAAATINPFVVTTSKWTILVYINAANDLYYASDLNVNQMEQVAGNPDVRFVLQWKQSRDLFGASSFDGVRRVLVKPDNTSTVVSEVIQSNLVDGGGNALDMGKPETLNDFIVWAKTFYPADRYALVIWNHGNGWLRRPSNMPEVRAFSYDDQTGSSIQMWEVDDALAGQNFDIIAWDASLMQMLEVAYELRSYTDFVVGSEESPPAEGYPYHLVFDDFRDNPDATTASLTQAFVQGMTTYPPYFSRKITQSSIDTTQLVALKDAVSTLGTELKNAYLADPTGMAPLIQNVRDPLVTQAYSPNANRYYRDLVHLCLNLEATGGMPVAVVNAAAAVRSQVALAIVHEGHNSQSSNSHGVSIDFSPFSTFGAVAGDYGQLKFAQDSQWDEWLSVAP